MVVKISLLFHCRHRNGVSNGVSIRLFKPLHMPKFQSAAMVKSLCQKFPYKATFVW